MKKQFNSKEIERVYKKADNAKLIKSIKLGLSVSLLTLFAGQASATGVPVVDILLNATAEIINGNIIALDADMTAQNLTLMTELYVELGNDDPTGNTGVIPQLLQKIDGDLGTQTTTLKQEIDNVHGLQTSTEMQKLTAQVGMAQQPDMNNACGETAYSTTINDAATAKKQFSIHNTTGGGPSTTGVNITKNEFDELEGSSTPESAMARTLIAKVPNGFCTDEQSKNGVGQCTKAGTNPGADLKSQALTQTVNTTQNSNYSIVYKSSDYDAAWASKDKLAGLAAPTLPTIGTGTAANGKLYATTPAGVEFTAMADIYNRRRDTVLNAAQQQIEFSTAGAPGSSSSDLNTRWASVATTNGAQVSYSTLFPDQTMPTTPSERELLRYYVWSRYANPSWQSYTGSADQVASLREIERMDAASLYISYLMLEKEEKNNELLAAILAQEYNPVTYDRLTELRKKVVSTAN